MKYILSLMVSIMLLFSCNNSNEKKNLNDQDQLIIAQDSTRSIKENKEVIINDAIPVMVGSRA